MMANFYRDGYEIHRGVFGGGDLAMLRDEADRIASAEGSVCVRHIRKKSGIFNRLATSPKLISLLDGPMAPVRSILFDKTVESNWPVPWHQDLTIAVREEREISEYGPWSQKDGAAHVQPPLEVLRGMATLRLHLDPTPAENGALKVLPGSQLLGKIPSHSVSAYVDETVVTCDCFPGDVLLMSPLILHASRKSVLPARRRVLHFEYAPPGLLNADLEWYED